MQISNNLLQGKGIIIILFLDPAARMMSIVNVNFVLIRPHSVIIEIHSKQIDFKHSASLTPIEADILMSF